MILSHILLAAESKGYAAACDRGWRRIASLAKVALTSKMVRDLYTPYNSVQDPYNSGAGMAYFPALCVACHCLPYLRYFYKRSLCWKLEVQRRPSSEN
eukprot:s2320_g3.t1